MAHAIERLDSDAVLQQHAHLEVRSGAYRYTIDQHDGQYAYSVTDGKDTVSLPVQWPFGRNSQTYVFEKDGKFYEGLVSYYPGAHGLDTTIGDQSIVPKTVGESFGRLVSPREIRSCFGCHSSGAVAGHELKLDKMTPGVTCQHCHQNADQHLQTISTGKNAVFPPRLTQASSEEISTFCGQCHRTWETVMTNRWFGVINVRFQPYRLAKSKCFDGVDRRMSCVGCHDPHKEVTNDTKAYDKNCLACHTAGAKPSPGLSAAHLTIPRSCPVDKENCVSCHMPQVDLPGAHRTFTDHYVRVVKANEPFPN